jgi:hypothetical protein
VKTLFLDGLIYELPYADLLPELSPSQFLELKEDIREKGCNIYPVLLRFPDPSLNVRRVIDGGHRLRAVYELRNEGNASVLLEVQSLSLESEEEERQAALDLNLKRRQLTPEERTAAILKLRQQNKSLRQIADVVGVSKDTVARTLSTVSPETVELPPVVTGKDGKERQAHRPVSSPAGEHPISAYGAGEPRKTAIQVNTPNDDSTDGQQRTGVLAADDERGDVAESQAPQAHLLAGYYQEGGEAHQTGATEDPTHATRRTPETAPGVQSSVEAPPSAPSPVDTNKKGPAEIHIQGEPSPEVEGALVSVMSTEYQRRGLSAKATPAETPAPLPSPEPSPVADKKGDVDELRAEIEKLRAENDLLRKKKAPAIAASDRDDHNTPPELLTVIRAFGGDQITMDPCSNQNSKVDALIKLTKEEDGLHADWAGVCAARLGDGGDRALTFVNPPYDQKTLAHVNEYAAENVSVAAELNVLLDVITLVPVKSDQPWYQQAIQFNASAVCWIAGRVRFWADGEQQSGAAFESVLFYYGDRSAEFCDCFGEEIGVCLDLKLYREARGAA